MVTIRAVTAGLQVRSLLRELRSCRLDGPVRVMGEGNQNDTFFLGFSVNNSECGLK